MSAALFDLPLEIETDDGDQMLWVGVAGDNKTLIAVDGEGYVQWMQYQRVRTKWRWLADQNMWEDLTVEPVENPEQVETSDGQG